MAKEAPSTKHILIQTGGNAVIVLTIIALVFRADILTRYSDFVPSLKSYNQEMAKLSPQERARAEEPWWARSVRKTIRTFSGFFGDVGGLMIDYSVPDWVGPKNKGGLAALGKEIDKQVREQRRSEEGMVDPITGERNVPGIVRTPPVPTSPNMGYRRSELSQPSPTPPQLPPIGSPGASAKATPSPAPSPTPRKPLVVESGEFGQRKFEVKLEPTPTPTPAPTPTPKKFIVESREANRPRP